MYSWLLIHGYIFINRCHVVRRSKFKIFKLLSQRVAVSFLLFISVVRVLLYLAIEIRKRLHLLLFRLALATSCLQLLVFNFA